MSEKSQCPIGATIRMADLSMNPYETFEQLQAQEPISWVEEIGMWYVTHRDDVLAILADTETFTVAHGGTLREVLGVNMLTTDGTDQYRLRKPFINAFAPRTVRLTATPFIERTVNRLIDDFIRAGTADIKSQFADPLAIMSVTHVLGLPVDDVGRYRQWMSAFAEGLGNFIGDADITQRAQRAKGDFRQAVLAHLRQLRQSPDESLLSGILQEGDLNDEEIVDSLSVIMFGGVETTSALICNALWLMLQPSQKIPQGDEALKNFIEEALRYESPVQTCTRAITRDVTVRGVLLRRGEKLQCMLGAVNRDGQHFDDAQVLQPDRHNADDHLAFGHGRHFCIGAGLARLEAFIGIRTLLQRLPDLHLSPDDAIPPRGHEFRSPPHLKLCWRVMPASSSPIDVS